MIIFDGNIIIHTIDGANHLVWLTYSSCKSHLQAAHSSRLFWGVIGTDDSGEEEGLWNLKADI